MPNISGWAKITVFFLMLEESWSFVIEDDDSCGSSYIIGFEYLVFESMSFCIIQAKNCSTLVPSLPRPLGAAPQCDYHVPVSGSDAQCGWGSPNCKETDALLTPVVFFPGSLRHNNFLIAFDNSHQWGTSRSPFCLRTSIKHLVAE